MIIIHLTIATTAIVAQAIMTAVVAILFEQSTCLHHEQITVAYAVL